MRMNLKDLIQVKTLANGQFEVRTTTGDKRPGPVVTLSSQHPVTIPTNMDRPRAQVLEFRKFSK